MSVGEAHERSANGSARTIVAVLFFVSGLVSLVFETVWVRAMVLVFGSTTFAVSTVLTAFMGGLALGSLVAGRRATGLGDGRRALAAYGLLELTVAAYALALPLLLENLPALHGAVWGTAQSSYWSFALLRFLLAFLLLVVPTAAMGATLPVLARYYEASRRDSAGCGAVAGSWSRPLRGGPTPSPRGAAGSWSRPLRGAPTPSPRGAATGREIGALYAINTAGATIGVLLAGFLLLPRLGLRATNLCACGADALLAGIALWLWRRERPREREAVVPTPPAPDEPGRSRLLAAVALASIGVSGGLAMIYQVAWNRALSLVIGSSTYAFSLILVCFLLGLTAGAALYSRRQSAAPDQVGNLAVIHLLTAGTALGSSLFLDRIPVALLSILERVELTPTSLFLIQFLLAGAVILLPTFFMGMVLPAVIGVCAREASASEVTAPRLIGNVYAVNTLGAILGSFTSGFLLIPLLGLERTLRATVIAGLCLAGGLAILARSRVRIPLLLGSVTCALLTVFLWRPWDLALLTAGVFRVSRYTELLERASDRREEVPVSAAERGWREAARRLIPSSAALDTGEEPSFGHRVVFHRDGVTTTVSGLRTVDESLSDRACWVRHSLLVNGKVDASLGVLLPRPEPGCGALLEASALPRSLAVSDAGDAETQVLSGLLPLLVGAGDRSPEKVLVIGWGSGMSVGAALQAPLRRLVAVELEREVIVAARVFAPENHSPERDPRLTLHAGDGRNFLHSTPERFDAIISEPSNPWMAGCGNLFTREFFQSVRAHLNRGGVFLQWLQAYEIAPENVWSILGTLDDVFQGAVHVFSPARASSDLLLLARREPAPLDWGEIARRLASPAIRRELGRVGIHEPADLVARLQAAPAGVTRLGAGAPRNTDDNARIEFATPLDMVNFRKYSSRRITSALRATLGDPLAGVRRAPADARGRLCLALIRAGRPRDALAAAPGDPTCQGLVERLRRRPATPGRSDLTRLLGELDPRVEPLTRSLAAPPRTAAAEVARALRPSEPRDLRAGLELLGRLRGEAGDRFPAVLYLTAARSLEPGTLDLLLARELYLVAQRGAALRLLGAP